MPEGRVSYNLYGSPGLVDMPTANESPDATLTTTISKVGDAQRTTIGFQITPRLSGAFRYSGLSNYTSPASVKGVYYDRSFDLRYNLLTETASRPAVTIGLQDFIGTGLYGGEYVVATKSFAKGITVTGGVGWGRLGSHGAIGKTGTRTAELLGQGGIPTYDRWFRGDFAPFGGVSWAVNDRMTVKAEYSSDNYTTERKDAQFNGTSPWNFGLDYTFKSGTQLSLYHAYGNQFGAQVTFATDLRSAKIPGGLEKAPVPVLVRPVGAAKDLGWTQEAGKRDATFQALKAGLANEGLVLEGLDLKAQRAVVRIRNPRYGNEAEAIGRTARAMTRAMPASVETFVIVPTVNGSAMSGVELQRTDIERLEHVEAKAILQKTVVRDAFKLAPPVEKGIYPKFTWSLAPYTKLSVFDPNSPVRADFGARLKADFWVAPNLRLSGSITKKVGGNLDKSNRNDKSNLPRVRTDYAKYSIQGDPAIERLTMSAYGRPGPNLYSRFTVGYLEEMYGGVSTELLWKRVNSPLALGVELNYVKQRDFDQMFGFRNYETFTGHASAYYAFGNGFHGQVDVGQYLAGDVGATLSLDREFANGWRVGAYATFTDASFEDFGEGSFDKGIRIAIPMQWVLGTASRQRNTVQIQSLTRDGGARLSVNDRLYEQVRDYHQPELDKQWGKFWR
ncbi:YjbH domain-containing protein [Pseudoprimorskyibacter insulae]|nr:YjbH domain-containing protein [Pseudoprimorskyibacter insulae]